MDDEQLYAFVADARAQVANASRRRTRWLQRQLREETGFADVCVALAGSALVVELRLMSGRCICGQVTATGADLVRVSGSDGTVTVLATSALIGLRVLSTQLPQGPLEPVTAVGGTERLSDELEALAARRCRVIVGTRSADAVYRGRLGGVGKDVVWFEDGSGYVRLAMITDVTILP